MFWTWTTHKGSNGLSKVQRWWFWRVQCHDVTRAPYQFCLLLCFLYQQFKPLKYQIKVENYHCARGISLDVSTFIASTNILQPKGLPLLVRSRTLRGYNVTVYDVGTRLYLYIWSVKIQGNPSRRKIHECFISVSSWSQLNAIKPAITAANAKKKCQGIYRNNCM